jgi:hypothetical protein
MPNRKPSPARRKCRYCHQSLTLRWCCTRRRREATWNAITFEERLADTAKRPMPF